MANADSTIRVNIIGDAKVLGRELDKAEGKLGKFGGNVNKVLGAAALVGVGVAVTDFADTALNEADRLGDATTRLEQQLGDAAQGLIDTADDFSKLGQSAQDILELEAAFADIATALGVADPFIATFADDAAATAAAAALLTGQDPSAIISDMGKAAGGSERAMKNLGIFLSEDAIAAQAMADTGKDNVDALTDSEIAAAGFKLVLEAMKPKLDDATSGTADLEQKQGELEARFETLTGKVGAFLDPIFTDFLGGLLLGIEGVEGLAAGTHEFKGALAVITTPLARFYDLLSNTVDAAFDLAAALQSIGRGGALSGGSISLQNLDKPSVNINVSNDAHDDIERQVINALRDHNRRNGHF